MRLYMLHYSVMEFQFKYFLYIFLLNVKFNNLLYKFKNINLTYGDWGLGIEDWAKSPIPNPHDLDKKS